MERLIERRGALALLGLPVALSLGSSLASCGLHLPPSLTATDLTAAVEGSAPPRSPIGDILTDTDAVRAAYGFTTHLLQGRCEAEPEGSVLVSPLSALFALALAENGAAGETLSQMEEATGMDVQGLTSYLGAYLKRIGGESLHDTRETGDPLALKSANSIWLRDSGGLSVRDSYLSTCKGSLAAQVFSAPFDETTRADINSWTSSKTDGMIKEVVGEIPDGAQLYLINALALDSAWSDPYGDDDVQDDTFTTEDGTEQSVRMMRSHEVCYLEGDSAEGFVKPYENHDLAFVALLPKADVGIGGLVGSLDGESLRELIAHAVPGVEVDAGLPKFTVRHQSLLNDQLKSMGMLDAFDASLADFSPLGATPDGNLAIDSVIQKTFIDVNERGTKAAAATSIGMSSTAAAPFEPEVREVVLDRPFAYLIIDHQTTTPLFAGVVTSVA